ncbi:MAG: outer membrane lipoprotein-sorting protein, partial [Oligoflexales bacterium]|nr:outer membrane lipoprotein-sorting protein [Oligoflexales bacterium]
TESRFLVKIKDGSKTYIETLAPARDKGRNMVMIGDDMWAYVPNLKRAVRIPLQQKISGQAANGDISRMSWSQDYKPVLEKMDGNHYVLMMTALRKGLTYEKIRLWIEKGTYRPFKGEYLNLSGEPIKKVRFEQYEKREGAMRPTVMAIEDAMNSKLNSKIILEKMKISDFPESRFTVSSLSE